MLILIPTLAFHLGGLLFNPSYLFVSFILCQTILLFLLVQILPFSTIFWKMGRTNFLLFAAFGLLSLTRGDQLHCYMPDGSNADQGTAPCNSTAAVSACCDPRDSCTTSGLCLGASGWIYRSACTDQTWNSPVCAQQCRTGMLPKTSSVQVV